MLIVIQPKYVRFPVKLFMSLGICGSEQNKIDEPLR
jgi:hypothetical protein